MKNTLCQTSCQPTGMGVTRRLQHRSCDPCRKGKRACDATVRKELCGARNTSPGSHHHHPAINVSTVEPCSNCKRWRRQCTFNWLLSVQNRGSTKQCRKKTKSAMEQDCETATVGSSSSSSVNHPLLNSNPLFSQPQMDGSLNGLSLSSQNNNDPFSSMSTWDPLVFSDLSDGTRLGLNSAENATWHGEPRLVPPPPDYNEDLYTTGLMMDDAEDWFQYLDSHGTTSDSKLDVVNTPVSPFSAPQVNGYGCDWTNIASCMGRPNVSSFLPRNSDRDHSPNNKKDPYSPPRTDTQLSLSSQRIVDEFFRSETARNLLRVYHDSIENALTCWLTERNCPYSRNHKQRSPSRSRISISIDGEWGPQWSNRICARVCRLDRAYAAVRGRSLTMNEERMASRALHAAIMAFASQWSPESVAKLDMHVRGKSEAMPSPLGKDLERSVPERLWNEASYVLNEAAHTESFRVIFAHMIFSLTQRPLNGSGDASGLESPQRDNQAPGLVELHRLFDSDRAPLFLETAVRQMFSCRHKLTRFQRECKTGSLSAEDHETVNLLFWLGVMFDTLTAAMYQRPLVVSDEDSEINCSVTQSQQVQTDVKADNHIDLDGWDFATSPNARKRNVRRVWGDLFLQQGAAGEMPENSIPRWPCAYEAAAETLSDAAPVKVLLFRRVTRLQTLVYRGAEPEQLEEAIQDTFRIYDYWNRTYGVFMQDCVAHHDSLPPRIQSWYVLLAGHWHLAAILLADTVESIDKGRMGLDSQRESRLATNLVANLKTENAVAISRLAQSSLRSGSKSATTTTTTTREFQFQFHDAVMNDGGAVLTEPWTAVLIRSFARAGYILLDRVRAMNDAFDEEARQQCAFCIEALWSLGKKSDMASVAARSLSSSLDEAIRLHCQNRLFV